MDIEKQIRSINAKLSLLLNDDTKDWLTWEQFEQRTGRVYTRGMRDEFKKNFPKCIRVKGYSTLINYKKWVEEHKPIVGIRE